MLNDVLLLLGLIVLNGGFALAEIAIVSARRVRLQQLADQGRTGAAQALQLAADPTRFLSTVQVGITTIGILSGAIGEAALAAPLRDALARVPLVAPVAAGLSITIIVVGLTYTSLILGELVPKRLAMTHPEFVARIVSRPMRWLSRVAAPVIYVLSVSTNAILKVLRVDTDRAATVSLDEIRGLIRQGTEEGVFEKTEQELVGNVLSLDDRHIAGVMTPRADIVFFDVSQPVTLDSEPLRHRPHTVVPVCDGGLDRVLGIVRTSDVLVRLARQQPVVLRELIAPPLFVPRTVTLIRLLEQLRHSQVQVALVVDEHGDVDGLVSLSDITTAIVGDRPMDASGDSPVVRRDDGSWLLDGAVNLADLHRILGWPDDADAHHDYHTLGGLVMFDLARVPRTGDRFTRNGWQFEVVDMDGNRVDRVLAKPLRTGATV